MSSTTQRMTRDEYLAWFPDDGVRRELLHGEVIVNEPLPLHQVATLKVAAALDHWCDAGPDRGLTVLPIDTDVSEDTILAPDVQWYAEAHRPKRLTVRPQPIGDIVIEVRSRSTWHYDIGAKRVAYEQAGAQEYWLVDPGSRSIVVLSRSSPNAPTFDLSREVDHTQTLTSPLLPGFAADVGRLLRAG